MYYHHPQGKVTANPNERESLTKEHRVDFAISLQKYINNGYIACDPQLMMLICICLWNPSAYLTIQTTHPEDANPATFILSEHLRRKAAK